MIARADDDRKTLREGGRKLGEILAQVAAAVVPGVTIHELDHLAERLIVESGGRPAFKGYHPRHATQPYPGTLCTSVNAEVVHGIPTRAMALKKGDIIGLDIGMRWPAEDGLYTDTAVTVGVGKVAKDARRLMDVTRQALEAGIAAAVVGNRVSDIARAVQTVVEGAKFSVVRDLVGHGVGRAVHEEPQVPNFWDARQLDVELLDGMVIAIEPMVAAGGWRVRVLPDGWTIVTADGSLAAHFEHTILITKEGTEVITQA
ncbi:MAG: type I methionyl aminopeptidase [bacterium]|nr:type I methionyl aminopeptidase [bacterium]